MNESRAAKRALSLTSTILARPIDFPANVSFLHAVKTPGSKDVVSVFFFGEPDHAALVKRAARIMRKLGFGRIKKIVVPGACPMTSRVAGKHCITIHAEGNSNRIAFATERY